MEGGLGYWRQKWRLIAPVSDDGSVESCFQNRLDKENIKDARGRSFGLVKREGEGGVLFSH